MQMNDDSMLERLVVNAKDRKFQLWERNSLSIDLFTQKVLEQKLNYIHSNPLQYKWRLAKTPESYYYSSASFYETSNSDFDFLCHYKG